MITVINLYLGTTLGSWQTRGEACPSLCGQWSPGSSMTRQWRDSQEPTMRQKVPNCDNFKKPNRKLVTILVVQKQLNHYTFLSLKSNLLENKMAIVYLVLNPFYQGCGSGSAFIFLLGFGSAFNMRMRFRIRIQYADADLDIGG